MEKESLAGELQIHNVNKWYPGKVHAVIDMNMEINQGEFIVFVGPSGCGKTTLLRMIAGLETISGGEVIMDGSETRCRQRIEISRWCFKTMPSIPI